jgi:methionyl-tRNA formyltransferase
MSKSKKLVFFGNERLATGLKSTGTPTLKKLIENGYEVTAVVSNFTAGRSRNARKLEIAEVAEQHNIPVMLPTHLGNIKDDIKEFNAGFGVLVAYGRIIPAEILDIFPHGIINIHPSRFAEYRGSTPIEQAILDGKKETGSSIMRLVNEMDAGPIYAQSKLELRGDETKEILAKNLLDLGSELLIDNLPAILDGSLQPKSQDNSKATYTKLLDKEDGLVNQKKPAEDIERQIRAFAGFPKSRVILNSQDIIITKARVAKDKSDGDLILQCSPGFLEVQELIAPSGRSISGADFLRGYSN